MTNERLKEIKDSIDFQKQYTIYKGFDMDLLQEEIDLYEEVVRLQERIDKTIEYINNHQLVFEKSNKKQIADWFSEFYKDLSKILVGKQDE